MEWITTAFTWNNATTKRELRAARSRKLSLKLRAPSTYSFSMLGDHPQAPLVTELITDVTVSVRPPAGSGYGQVDVLRARCGSTQDDVQESGYSVGFAFADYRAVLQRRALKAADTLNYLATEQSDIAWGMINQVQGRTNGNYGITRGSATPTGQVRDKTNLQGTYVGKNIDELAAFSNGFEWDVSPAMVFNLYYPTRGDATAGRVNLEYGKSVTAFTRTRTPSGFANDDILTGGQQTTPYEIASATVTTDPQGRWDGVMSYADIDTQSNLIARGAFAIAATSTLLPQYAVQLSPGFWKGPAHIGLGDALRLRVLRGRINDNLVMRVLEINVDIGDDGSEDVRLTLGAV